MPDDDRDGELRSLLEQHERAMLHMERLMNVGVEFTYSDGRTIADRIEDERKAVESLREHLGGR